MHLGTGKTTTAQYIALKNIKLGIPVYSNRSLAGCYKVSIEDLGSFDFCVVEDGIEKRGGVLIIDEAGIDLNNRDWKSLNHKMIEFFKLHRHYKLNIYVLTQGIDIDLTVRRLITCWFKVVRYYIFFGLVKTPYTKLIPVYQTLTIENGDWKIKYEVPKSIFVGQKINMKKIWHLFDSFDAPTLPKKEFEKWYELPIDTFEHSSIFDKLKNMFIFCKHSFIKLLKRFYNKE